MTNNSMKDMHAQIMQSGDKVLAYKSLN